MIRLIILITSIIFALKKFHDAKIGVKTTQNKKNGNARLATKNKPCLSVIGQEGLIYVDNRLLFVVIDVCY